MEIRSHRASGWQRHPAWLEIPLLLGETVGWKVWRMEDDGIRLFDPLAAGRVWVPDQRSALCDRCARDPMRFKRCHCGWRSQPNPPESHSLIISRLSDRRIVYGAVGLCGLISYEPNLLRAERERPLAFHSTSLTERESARLAASLGVYAHPSIGSILDSLDKMRSVALNRPRGLSNWKLI